MKRATIDVVWKTSDLNKVFNAIARYNEIFRNKIDVVKSEVEDGGGYSFTWLTIRYVDDPKVLLWFGVMLGEEGL